MDELIELFAECLKVSPEILSDDSSPENIPQWDSLASMNLVVAIEERFGVSLTTREIMRMRTIGIAREVLSSRKE